MMREGGRREREGERERERREGGLGVKVHFPKYTDL